MSKKLKVAIVGGIIALVVGFAASNGLITQQTADEIKNQSDQILSEDGNTAPAPDAANASDTSQAPAEQTAPTASAEGTTPAAPAEPTAPADETAPADDAAISIEPAEQESAEQPEQTQ